MCCASRICEKTPAGLVLRRGRVFLELILVGLRTCQTRRPRRLLEILLNRPLSFQARAMYLQAV